MNKKIEQALNDQINAEIYSSYLYYSMAAYFESIDLTGFGSWMKVQAEEELIHVRKLFNYVCERGGRVLLAAIESPKTEWESPVSAMKNVYSHEQKVTGLINKLVDLAISESDHATNNFLQWFVAEQVEEEATTGGLAKQLEFIKDNPQGIFMMDRELKQRVLTPPAE